MEHDGDNYTNCDWFFWYSNKGLLMRLEDLEVGGQVETIPTTALLRMARILRRGLETCSHSVSSERPSAKTDVKNSEWVNNNNNNVGDSLHTHPDHFFSKGDNNVNYIVHLLIYLQLFININSMNNMWLNIKLNCLQRIIFKE